MNIDRRKHGYLALSRHSKFLYQQLGSRLYGFYITLAMEAGWDRRYPSFGKVMGTQAQLGRTLGVDQSTISRNLQGLMNKHKQLVIPHKNYLLLGFFPLFSIDVAQRIYSSNYSNLYELYADMHRINAELQEKNAVSQINIPQKSHQRLYISSNNNLSTPPIYSDSNTNEIDIDEVYEGIKRINKDGDAE